MFLPLLIVVCPWKLPRYLPVQRMYPFQAMLENHCLTYQVRRIKRVSYLDDRNISEHWNLSSVALTLATSPCNRILITPASSHVAFLTGYVSPWAFASFQVSEVD